MSDERWDTNLVLALIVVACMIVLEISIFSLRVLLPVSA